MFAEEATEDLKEPSPPEDGLSVRHGSGLFSVRVLVVHVLAPVIVCVPEVVTRVPAEDGTVFPLKLVHPIIVGTFKDGPMAILPSVSLRYVLSIANENDVLSAP